MKYFYDFFRQTRVKINSNTYVSIRRGPRGQLKMIAMGAVLWQAPLKVGYIQGWGGGRGSNIN